MADKMDVQITLTTSDDPPISLAVSRVALVTHAKVFADMFSLDRLSNENKPLELDKTEMELRPLLSVIGGQDGERVEILSELSEEGWETLAKLVDKYDCWAIRKFIEEKSWSVATDGKLTAFAFALATTTSNEALICYTAKQVVTLDESASRELHVAQEWKDRLDLWRQIKGAKIPVILQSYSKRIGTYRSYYCSEPSCPGSGGWMKISGNAFTAYNIRSIPPLPVSRFVNVSGACINCERRFRGDAHEFERETSKWEDFPIKGVHTVRYLFESCYKWHRATTDTRRAFEQKL